MNEIVTLFSNWSEALTSVLEIWKLELFKVEGDSITLGKVLLGLVLFVFGFSLSKILTSIIDRKFFSKLQIDASTRFTFKTFTYYLTLILIILSVLKILHVPLTIFTFVGGALAIGVGYG
jgi:small-conductance mechanosensitive channel